MIPVFPRRRPTKTYTKFLKYSYKPPPTDDQRIWGRAAATWLRHYAHLRPDAFTPIANMNASNTVPHTTLDRILQYVKNDRSNRFQVVSNLDKVDGQPGMQKAWYIRARQGHSIPGVDISTLRVTIPSRIPPFVYAAKPELWNLIERNGIQPEYPNLYRPLNHNPNFIYFTTHLDILPPSADSSPILQNQETVQLHISLNTAAAMKAGIKFFRTKHNQIISTGLADRSIPPAFIDQVQVVVLKKELLDSSPPRVKAQPLVQEPLSSRSQSTSP